jgi:hypothetical protein
VVLQISEVIFLDGKYNDATVWPYSENIVNFSLEGRFKSGSVCLSLRIGALMRLKSGGSESIK